MRRAGEGAHEVPSSAVAVSVDGGPATRDTALEAFVDDHVTTLAAVAQCDIVHIEVEPVGAVEVTDGDVTGLAGVSAQVNGILIPIALRTAAAARNVGRSTSLGCHRPLLDGGEVGGVGLAARGDSDTEVLSGVVGILSASPEAERATEGHLMRNDVVVRIEDTVVVVVAL